jgi:hypothetical protein
MKSFAPMSPRIICTGKGNRLREGSCTMVGAESKYLTPRNSLSRPWVSAIRNPSGARKHSLASGRPCLTFDQRE